jgi:hypothetical protein
MVSYIEQNPCKIYMWTSRPAREANLPGGSFWRAKLTTSDDIRNFLTHVTTFQDLCTTLMTNGDDILRLWIPRVKTLWRPWQLVVKTLRRPLLQLTTTLWLPPMTSLTTHVTTLMVSIIFIVPMIETKWQKWQQVMTRMTNSPNWCHGKSCVTTNVTTPHDMWRLKWRPKYNPNDPSNPGNPDDPDNSGWLSWTINVTTCWRPSKFSWQHLTTPSGNIYCHSRKLPVLLATKPETLLPSHPETCGMVPYAKDKQHTIIKHPIFKPNTI